MIKVAIVAAAGYTGEVLVKILLTHPETDLVVITSETNKNRSLAEVFPGFASNSPLVFEENDYESIAERVDVVFLCLPHRESMAVAPVFLGSGVTVFDLSADFRLKSSFIYQEWYGVEHTATELIEKAVYGLPELHKGEIAEADLVAVPGCYPTSALLALAPVINLEWIDVESVIIHSVSGSTGAGKKAKTDYLHAELAENCYAYGAPKHRHTPEIEQELSLLASSPVIVTFMPHMIPATRGIYTTVTVKMDDPHADIDVLEIYRAFYRESPFVTVVDGFPEMKWANGTNTCYIGVKIDERAGTIIIASAIDNLIKGASGQAVQCYNIRHKFDESLGLP